MGIAPQRLSFMEYTLTAGGSAELLIEDEDIVSTLMKIKD